MAEVALVAEWRRSFRHFRHSATCRFYIEFVFLWFSVFRFQLSLFTFPFSPLPSAKCAISARSVTFALFAIFAICAHTSQQSPSLIINDLKNKASHPTDFLGTHSQTSSKSPQKSIPTSFLTEILSLTLWMTKKTPPLI